MIDNEVILYLPQLTFEEYFRNRDKIVIEQLQEIKKLSLKVGIPIFIREMGKSKEFQDRLKQALDARNSLLQEVEAQASARTFRADELIKQIFDKAKVINTTSSLVERARDRLDLGNPPGKINSIGDRLNWESLLSEVPTGNDLHLLTRDSDYFALFAVPAPNMFLVNEWRTLKQGEIYLYRGIKGFASKVDQSIVFEIEDPPIEEQDPIRTAAIDDLACCGSFSMAHSAVANLMPYIKIFTTSELERLMQIACDNSQVGGIIGDNDLNIFYTKIRARLPFSGNTFADTFDLDVADLSEIPF